MKRQYPRIRCNDIVNNSQCRAANCYTAHWPDAVLMVQENPDTCWRCDLRQPVPTKRDREFRCREIIRQMFPAPKPKRPKQMKLAFIDSTIDNELPF